MAKGYGQRFTRHSDADLVRFWNDGGGGLAWTRDLEAELQRRGYETRSLDPNDGRERLGGERLLLTIKAARV